MGNMDINLVSWNINGCSTPIKRKKVLSYLKSHGTDVAFIQETHFGKDKEALKMRRDWVGKVFHNSVSSKSRGVMTLINKKLNFVFLKQLQDDDGRLLCIQALINGIKVVLVNVYAPNGDEPDFIYKISKMLSNLEGHILIGGDFNQVPDDFLDKSTNNVKFNTRKGLALNSLKEEIGLVDIWRLVHPSEREYTFYSHSHKSYSRIDYFLISNSSTELVTNCEIGVIALTDHAPVELHIQFQMGKIKRGRWRLNLGILRDEQFVASLKEEIKCFLDINIGSTDRLATVWDALKAFMRGKCLGYSSKKARESREKIKILENQIKEWEKQLAQNYNESTFKEICKLKFNLHETYNKKAEYALFRLKTNFYEKGEKTGKLLARQLKQLDNQNVITAIKKNDRLVTSSGEINTVFEQFYQKLYTSETAASTEQLDAFYNKVTIPQISREGKDAMDSILTEAEVRKAISKMKTGKSPGIDGFPVEYYQTFTEVLCPFLTKVLQEAYDFGTLPESFNQAIISLIPKGDKDLTDPANYRPISLINVDCKILSKILAMRLEKELPKIIHKDQVGFVKNRLSADNMRRLLHLLWMNKHSSNPVVAISLDAQKAFDRVEWNFLFTALTKFGFGDNFCRWIKTLYSRPKAAVFTNGVLSPFFDISRSTRQGCSLSPLLFTIFLEPLAIQIREDPRIKGVYGGDRDHKLFLYADDILILSQDPANSIPTLLEVMNEYSKLSGYKINWHKSEAMPVSQTCTPSLLSGFNFRWVDKGMKYLGIELNPSILDIMADNMEKLLTKIKTNLDKWSKLNLTLWGKVNTIKMAVAPLINYYTGMLPMSIPKQILLRYNKMIKEFLWNGGKPRISMDRLCQPKKDGGLALPNIEHYSISFEMSRLTKHWVGRELDADWVLVERGITFPFTPMEILVQKPGEQRGRTNNPILEFSKMVWLEVHKKCKLSPHLQKYASLWHNPKIKIGKRSIYWAQWLQKGIRTIGDVFQGDIFMSYDDIKMKYNLEGHGNFWRYLQLRDCLKGKVGLSQDGNPIENFLRLPTLLGKASKWYKICPWAKKNTSKGLKTIWERDLRCIIDDDSWQTILSDNGIYIREARGKFIQYKILNRYYYTPSRLHVIGISENDLCWKCHKERGTFIHAIWECPLISRLWSKVLECIQGWIACELPKSARLCLLGDRKEVPLLSKTTFRVLNTGLVTCARLILKLWKEPQIPTLKMWKEKMIENSACEKMLGRVSCKNIYVAEKWDSFCLYLSMMP
uniref:Reverse transcriptase domain-containing protein n=1 Tax=Oryzias latipes TaxID=8090 RepID=A0A3P9I561_ORYLA